MTASIQTERPNSLSARDARYHFHGYTNALRNEQDGGFVVMRGDGPFVYTEEGKEYFDGLAGLWCASLGFGPQPRLVAAAKKQMETLPFYHTFTQKVASPVVELAEKLVNLAPVPMSKAYFCNSGSEANDTALKMIWYLNNALGRPEKKKVIARVKAYHGVTVAAASLTGLPALHNEFDLPIARILRTDCPHYYRFGEKGESEEAFATRCADNLEKLILAEGPDTVAGFFAEPVQGAGGVIIPAKTYWEKITKVLKKYDVLLVADEVICGFGRTGNWWGTQTFGLQPDIITTAKQLSAGQLPIAAILINQRVFEALRDNSNKLGGFAHGLTYSGHPVSSAVALETIKIYEDERIVDHVRSIAPHFEREMNAFADHPLVGDVRKVGLVGAIELVKDKESHESFDAKLAVGPTLVKFAHEHGLIIRPVLDSLCFCPPLISTTAQISEMFGRFARALKDTHDWLKREGYA